MRSSAQTEIDILSHQEIEKIFDDCMKEQDRSVRDSLFKYARLQASFAQLDSHYINYTIGQITDSLVAVSRQAAIYMCEDLLFRKSAQMDSTSISFAHQIIGEMLSYQPLPSKTEISKAGRHARLAMQYSPQFDFRKCNSLILHYIQTKNDSVLYLLDTYYTDTVLNSNSSLITEFVLAQWYDTIGDYTNQLVHAKNVGGMALILAYTNNKMYAQADSLYALIRASFRNPMVDNNYLAMQLAAHLYTEWGKYDLAEKLLDSCFAYFSRTQWVYEGEKTLLKQLYLYKKWRKPTKEAETYERYNALIEGKLSFWDESQSSQIALLNTIKQAEFDGLKEIERESHIKDQRLLMEERKSNLLIKWFTLIAFVLTTAAVSYYFYVRFKMRSLKLKQRANFNRMRLELLRSQFKPHFTFNALSIVNYQLYKKDVAKAEETIMLLSNLMRDMLEVLSEPLVTIDREISFLTNYLELEKVRVSNAFNYTFCLDENLNTEHYFIPGAITQVLIENTLKHGFSELKEKGEVYITLKKEAQHFSICVEDNGKGLLEQRAKKQPSRGLGLVEKRMENLSQIFKKAFRFNIENNPNKSGVLATLTFPFITEYDIEKFDVAATKK